MASCVFFASLFLSSSVSVYSGVGGIILLSSETFPASSSSSCWNSQMNLAESVGG